MFHSLCSRRRRMCAAAFVFCLLLGAPACVDKNRTAPPAPPAGESAGDLPPAVQSSASPALRRNALPLPAVPKAGHEEALNKALSCFAAAMSQEGGSGSLSPDNGLKTMEDALAAAAEVLKDRETARNLYMYKYALRYLTERVLFLDPQADGNNQAVSFFTQGKGRWEAPSPEWAFEPFDEACYAILYGGGKVNPRGPEGQGETIPNPVWSTQVLLAVRGGDLQKMRSLHEAAGFSAYPRWPLETFLQLFACPRDQGGQAQWAELTKAVGDKPVKGVCWAEIGLGDGRLFSVLRRELGKDAQIYGADDDENCIVLAALAERSGKADWGTVNLVQASAVGCGLPAAGADFIHVNRQFLAGIPKESYASELKPFWQSLQTSLKPGGLLITETDAVAFGDLRAALKSSGFKESRVYEDKEGSADGQASVCAAFILAE